jgi:eukaryotic-like serine/threonine-protein kinase
MPQFDELAQTREYSPPLARNSSSLRDRVALIEADEDERTDESLAAWAQRLQTVCAILWAGFLTFFVRTLLAEPIIGPMRWLWAFVFAVLGLSSALLVSWKWGRNLDQSARKQGPRLTCRRLLLVELLLFGGTACYFAAFLHVVAAGRMGPNWVVYHVMSSMTWSCVLAFTYTMIAADARPRAIGMVTLLLGAPVAVVIYEWFASARFADVVNAGMVTMIVLTGVICWGALFYSVYRLNRLKQDAARARRFGQYRLKQLIGRGGMGEVYLAEHTLLKRPCALKRIRPGHDTDPTTLARFEREVRATAELSHPHTVEIYDYGRAGDGTFYYVMELLWGLTLDDLVHKQGPLPAARAVYLLRQVCDALGEAHAAGLMHRDIKPSNIYAARRGGEYDFVKLLDFGLVKWVAGTEQPALSRVETVVGSPLYMAPEQSVSVETSDVRADIYSLGAVGYFLLVGHPPFVADNPLEIMISHARDAVQPPSQLVPDLPADVEAILLKCLAKDPAERFASSAALGRALAACSVAGEWTRDDAAGWWSARADSLAPGFTSTGDTESLVLNEGLPLDASLSGSGSPLVRKRFTTKTVE